MYSCVGAPSGVKPLRKPNQAEGEEYSLVGPATLPRAAGAGSDGEMYALVGQRPPSKSAPPTYEMVQAVRKSSPSETIQESAQEIKESTDLYVNTPTEEEEEGQALYDVVQDRQTGPKLSKDDQGTPPQTQTHECEKQKPASGVTAIYSVPSINRKKNLSARGLSIISENAESGKELVSEPTPEEIAPPLPPKVEESLAMDAIKRFLEETKVEDAENQKNCEITNGEDEEEDVFPDQNVSAFQQLKALLQRLDSTEAE